jgi:outer membrane murein-binding lipoprotein Lpp
MRNIKKNIILFTSLAGILLLSGCASKEDKETAAFSSSISDFTSYLSETDTKINSLDTTQKESCDELLELLDGLEEEFAKLADLDVPSQYDGIKTIAQSASLNMSSAVSYYHDVYEGDTFDYDDSQTAYEYYKRAMLEVECIGYILANEDIPDGLLDDVGIQVTVSGESNDKAIINKLLGDETTNTED